MIVPFLNLKSQYQSIKSEIDEAIQSVFESGIFVSGPAVQNFENEFKRLYEVQECIGVGNGTDALFTILKGLGIGPGHEVITPAFSWISTSETISLTGAQPVFADVDEEFYTVSPQTIESKITNRTKAIVVVHLFGQVAPINDIKDLCQRKNLLLLEDCAQAHLSRENGTLAGKFGTAAAFSFYPTKNLGAYGDAGCVITDDGHLGEKFRRFANHGGLIKDEHLFEGMNSRLDPIQAAVLTIKLKHLETWTEKRTECANFYSAAFQNVNDLKVPSKRQNTHHTFHVYAVRSDHRDALQTFLNGRGIQTLVHYPCALPFEPAYSHFNYKANDFPVAYNLSKTLLSLPVYPELTIEQREYVVEMTKKFFIK